MSDLPLVGGSVSGSGSVGSPALTSTSRGSSSAGSPVSGAAGLPRSTSASRSSASGSSKGSARGGAGLALPGVGSEAGLDGTGAHLVGGGNLGLLELLGLLGLGVAVEVQVDDVVPLGLAGRDGAAQTEHLTGEHPPDETDGVAAFVVGGDGHVDESGGRLDVAEGDDGDVDVRGLLDGLGVGAGVRHDDETGLLERAGDVVGEGTGGEAAGNGTGAGVRSELEDSALAVGTGGDDTDVGGVVDGRDDTGSEDNLLPRKGKQLVLQSAIPIPCAIARSLTRSCQC